MPKYSFKLVVEYDGTDYAGWQIQPNKRTIQSELENALSKLFQEEISVNGAGRTDAGVHAKEQVVNFTSTKNRDIKSLIYGVNSLLPGSISIISAQSIDEKFNARFDAIRRHYLYQITRSKSALNSRFSWCVQENLNISEMQQGSRLLIGEHDFQSFCSTQAEVNHYLCTVLEVYWRYTMPDILTFYICANRFLHKMVRILVGTMVEVGKGRFSVEDFKLMLIQKDRKVAGITAPAKGLCLIKIEYDRNILEV